MANEPEITIDANLAVTPEIRMVGGKRITTLRVLQTPRRKKDGAWGDAEPLAYDLTIWDEEVAANAVKTFEKGDAVLAIGRIRAVRAYQSKGEQRLVTDVDVTRLGPSLKRASAAITRNAPRERHDPPVQSGGSMIAQRDPGFDVVGIPDPWSAPASPAGWPAVEPGAQR